MKKKIAIIGTVGVPSKYGGFETLVENLTEFLGKKIEITIYCSSKEYETKLAFYNNAKLEYIPLAANGLQSIVYDILSLSKCTKNQDVVLILGISGCIILPLFRLLYSSKKLIINIDGLEHRRKKWKRLIQKFLKYSEKLAVRYGDVIIADNKAIQEYVKKEYNAESLLITYGGNHTTIKVLTSEVKLKYSLPEEYAFKVCRIEPENNIHLILEAFSSSSLPLVLIGNWDRCEYGRTLKQKYSHFRNLYLINPIYDQEILNQIRSNCLIYIHGHSAGGTNPSLTEAMYLGLPVFAFDISYNRETTFNQAQYFKNTEDLKHLIDMRSKSELNELGIKMKTIAQREYTWEKIAYQYLELFLATKPKVIPLPKGNKTVDKNLQPTRSLTRRILRITGYR